MSDPETARHLYDVEIKNGYAGSFEYFQANDLERRLVVRLPVVDLGKRDLDTRNEASRYVGIICLARCSLVYLLWSHYGDCHRGCAIGVDVQHECFGRSRVNEGVNYEIYRPERKWDREGPSLWEELRKLSVTKSQEWKYEREHRIAFPLEELDSINGQYFVTLHPQAVRRVIYGEQIDPEFMRRIELLLRHPDFSHVRRFQIKRDPTGYSLKLARM